MNETGGSVFSFGEMSYKLRYNAILKAALAKARLGTLESTWRTDLASDNPDTSTAVGDATHLAVQEVHEMAAADWEPGNAACWRDALDAWYAASRIVAGAEFTGVLEQQIRLVAGANRAVLHNVSRLVPEDLDNPDRNNFFWDLIGGPAQRLTDGTLHSAISCYVAERDWLTASYLAGLAVGGTPGPDWREWLRTRAAEWVDSALARRVELETKSRIHSFDKPLPVYWYAQ